MSKISDFFTSTLGVLGISLAVTDVNMILNLVLLLVSILNIIVVIIFKIVKALKDGKLDDKEIDDIIKEIEEGRNEVNKYLK